MRIFLAIDGDVVEINMGIKRIESVIQAYGIKKGISNPYQYFSEQLGYKARNYLYKILSSKDAGEIKLKDIKTIIHITGDKTLADVIYQELMNA